MLENRYRGLIREQGRKNGALRADMDALPIKEERDSLLLITETCMHADMTLIQLFYWVFPRC